MLLRTGRSGRRWTHRPLVGALLHQAEELLGGAVEALLLVQLLHRGQQLVHDRLQLSAADGLGAHVHMLYHVILTTHTVARQHVILTTHTVTC